MDARPSTPAPTLVGHAEAAPESASTVVQQQPQEQEQQPQEQPEVDDVVVGEDAADENREAELEEELDDAARADDEAPLASEGRQRKHTSQHGRSRRERPRSRREGRSSSSRRSGREGRRRRDEGRGGGGDYRDEYGGDQRGWAQGGRGSYRGAVVSRANELLRRVVGDHAPFSNEGELQESASSMFVAIFETMMECRLKEVHREPEFSRHYRENAQSVIDGLSQKLDMGLDHIDSGLIADGNLDHIGALIDVFLVAAGPAGDDGYEDELDGDLDGDAADAEDIARLRRDHPAEWRSLMALRNESRRGQREQPRVRGSASGSIRKAAEARLERARFEDDRYVAQDRRARVRDLARQDRNDERDHKVRDVQAMRMRDEIRRERASTQKRAETTEHRLARDLFRKTLKVERERLLRSRQRTRDLKNAAEEEEAAKLEAVEKFYNDQIGMLTDHIKIEKNKAKEWKQSRKAVSAVLLSLVLYFCTRTLDRARLSLSLSLSPSRAPSHTHALLPLTFLLLLLPFSLSPPFSLCRRPASACVRCTAPRWVSSSRCGTSCASSKSLRLSRQRSAWSTPVSSASCATSLAVQAAPRRASSRARALSSEAAQCRHAASMSFELRTAHAVRARRAAAAAARAAPRSAVR